MSKRELGQLGGTNEIEGPRTKRRRETAGASSDVDITSSERIHLGAVDGDEGIDQTKEEVKELGLKLWQTVRDAVNKEPPKRQYPDYYRIITRPIALDDIKKQIETVGYPNLEAVRQDFELCFNNAKTYNMKDSDIWRDAKDLLKLANKTCVKLLPQDEDGENVDGEGKGKSKAPSLNRLIKSRLQKLVDKTDDSGRVLSVEFMELPSKKDWPGYYQQIKRPQCLENIFKRIKRKEYSNASEFATDVELVFANAMTFNQDHTGIWEDAKALRDHFRLLMVDLPPPFALPEYVAKPKIKIKPQITQQATPTLTIPAVTQPIASSSQTLRIPAVKQVKVSPVSTPATPASSLPPATVPNPPPVVVTKSTPVHQLHLGTPQTIPYMNTTFSHYPNASYIPPLPTPAAPTASTSTSNLQTDTVVQASSASSTPPPPVIHQSHQLKSISLVVQPRGRRLVLDYQDGVKCWAMRLVPGETEIHVSNVVFMGDEEDESSEEEEDDKHEEEEEEHAEPDTLTKKKKGKRGRGRPKGTTRAAVKTRAAKKKKEKVGPIQVKFNGAIVKEQEDETCMWTINPAVGSGVLEVGEDGGLIWKVYIQRIGDE
ncbi:hypothetical protein H0H81_003726 [Sphagnurus paluster]|uniref:Bromo domain-containing protein n=1 Tax=Sphagnurus paluster TaxID=117069 RepID=A0A9P7K612_9AGAR|nr:hypothetical protein H0H81_003726 [Sphagnurus paluster]